MHKRLVYDFFKNSSQMLRFGGEIHVNHKTTAPFCDWNIIQLAHQNSLELIGSADFNIQDYPGYNNKRGQGSRCDDPFFLGECSTYKFSINHRAYRTPNLFHMNAIDMHRNLPFQDIPISNQCHSHPHSYRYPYSNPTSFASSYSHSHMSMPNHRTPFEPEYSRLTDHSINPHSYQAPPQPDVWLNTLGVFLSRFMARMPERTSNDVGWPSVLRSNYGEEVERSVAHPTPGLFRHW